MSKKTKAMYPGLSKHGDIKIRHELYDQDYADRLCDEDKLWLSNFNLEYINADFNHSGTRIHKEAYETRTVVYTGKRRKFDVGKKDAQDRNNARNRDAFAITKANFILEGEHSLSKGADILRSTKLDSLEDVLIEMIDLRMLPEELPEA